MKLAPCPTGQNARSSRKFASLQCQKRSNSSPMFGLRPDRRQIGELVLLWFALQRFANREQEDGTLVFGMRRKEVNYIIVEEGQPGRKIGRASCRERV